MCLYVLYILQGHIPWNPWSLGFMPYFCGTYPPQGPRPFKLGSRALIPATNSTRETSSTPSMLKDDHWADFGWKFVVKKWHVDVEAAALHEIHEAWSSMSKIVKEHVLFGVWLTLSSWSCHFLAKEASAWMSVALVFPCISVAMAKYRLSGQHPSWHPVSPQSSKEWQVSTTSLHSKSRRESRKPQGNKAT